LFFGAAGTNALAIYMNGSTNAVTAALYSVSGTTVTSLSNASQAGSTIAHCKVLPLSDGRFFVAWTNTNWSASIVSISGSTVSIATPVTSANMEVGNAQSYGTIAVAKADATKIVVGGYRASTGKVNFEIITNTGGTPSIGTTLSRFIPINASLNGITSCSIDNANKVCFVASFGTGGSYFQWFEVDISGASPTLSNEMTLLGDTTFVTPFSLNTSPDVRNFPFDAMTAQNATTGAVVRFTAAYGTTRTPWGVIASSTGLRKAYVQPENAMYSPAVSVPSTPLHYSGADFWLQSRDTSAGGNELYVWRVKVSI
jgi:hypothetical protein